MAETLPLACGGLKMMRRKEELDRRIAGQPAQQGRCTPIGRLTGIGLSFATICKAGKLLTGWLEWGNGKDVTRAALHLDAGQVDVARKR